ncbi:hypothetical protein [Natrinema sp. 74]|uniref:hypothetical protein n=1 Tax=Natrinema sp. 74 TaxID=3384159 RepID=UPI0038D3782C
MAACEHPVGVLGPKTDLALERERPVPDETYRLECPGSNGFVIGRPVEDPTVAVAGITASATHHL